MGDKHFHVSDFMTTIHGACCLLVVPALFEGSQQIVASVLASGQFAHI
jgi:hypothetical protein